MKVFELANKVGVSAVYITQIEKHNKLPSGMIFKRIFKALEFKDTVIVCDYLEQKYPQFSGLVRLFWLNSEYERWKDSQRDLL